MPGPATKSISAASPFRRRAAPRVPTSPPPPVDTHPLCFTLIRVLDDDGKAVGPWDPRLDAETLRRMLRDMLLIRAFDDRMYRAQRQGKTSFYMKCTGEEAIAVGGRPRARPRRHVLPDLSPAGPPDRARLSARRDDEPDLLEPAATSSRAASCRSCIRTEASGFFSISGNLAHAVPAGGRLGDGVSAIKGDSRIAAAWIGDGATAEGDFHNALTFAARLPRAGHPQRRQQPVGDLELLGHRRRRAQRPSPRARSATALPACGSTATTCSPSMPRPAGRPTARAPTSGRR